MDALAGSMDRPQTAAMLGPVLVVEDDATIRMGLTFMLEDVGYDLMAHPAHARGWRGLPAEAIYSRHLTGRAPGELVRLKGRGPGATDVPKGGQA